MKSTFCSTSRIVNLRRVPLFFKLLNDLVDYRGFNCLSCSLSRVARALGTGSVFALGARSCCSPPASVLHLDGRDSFLSRGNSSSTSSSAFLSFFTHRGSCEKQVIKPCEAIKIAGPLRHIADPGACPAMRIEYPGYVFATGTPICPPVAGSTPMSVLRRVVFSMPLWPRMPTNSPSLMEKGRDR